MQLVTYLEAGNASRSRAGLLMAGNVLDVSAAASQLRAPGDFSTVLGIVQAGEAALDALRRIAMHADELRDALRPLEHVKLLAPIPSPLRNVFCVGRNYLDHVKETSAVAKVVASAPKVPQFFTKATHTVIGPDAVVQAHSNVTSKLDYEVELAVIIGKRGRDIPREAAFDYIFGYSIANDVTARDLQRRHEQWFKGKSLDTTLPLGPAIVTRDEVPDVTMLELRLSVNGELRQAAHAVQMIFDIPTIIESLSAGLTLEPGDIIATGTPAGVGFAMDPPRYLQPGDVMLASISGLGELRNQITAA